MLQMVKKKPCIVANSVNQTIAPHLKKKNYLEIPISICFKLIDISFVTLSYSAAWNGNFYWLTLRSSLILNRKENNWKAKPCPNLYIMANATGVFSIQHEKSNKEPKSKVLPFPISHNHPMELVHEHQSTTTLYQL